MPKGSARADIPPRFAGQHVVFAGKTGAMDWQDDALKIVAAEGGKVAPKLDATTTLLVARPGSKGATDLAAKLNKAGKASIRVLDEKGFFDFLAPTRDEALLLLGQGPKGVKRFHRLTMADVYSPSRLVTLDLKGIALPKAQLAGCQFLDSALDGADFRGADLTGANAEFKKANLEGACLSKANIRELESSNLTDADLRGATFCNGALKSNFTNANLSKARASYSEYTGSTFANANMEKADFEDADLSGTDLRNANLAGAKLSEANLRKADLTGANLTGADLGGANLSGANLTNACFTNAVLTTADLGGATVKGATFAGAKLSGAKLPPGLTEAGPEKSASGAVTTKAKIGPHLKKLEAAARKAQRLKLSARVTYPDGHAELSATMDAYGWVATNGARYRGKKRVDTFTGSEPVYAVALALSKLANRFADGEPTLEKVTAQSTKSAVTGTELKRLVENAWAEALGV